MIHVYPLVFDILYGKFASFADMGILKMIIMIFVITFVIFIVCAIIEACRKWIFDVLKINPRVETVLNTLGKKLLNLEKSLGKRG